MSRSYFIWNNIDCRSMGIVLYGPAPIVRPEERVNHVVIPGKSGDMTQTEGEDIFNSYIQTVTMHVRSGFRVKEVYKWLRGSGYVTFSGEPDRRQKARIIGAITLNRHGRNMDWWTGEVQFYCQPLKELMNPQNETITTTGATVYNMGDVAAKPLYKVTPSGTSLTLTVTGANTPAVNAITVTGLTSGTVIWIDSDSMEVWNADRSATITQNSTGEFPVLSEGANTVTFTGASSIEIEKRERFL